jgi:hypothetical protein
MKYKEEWENFKERRIRREGVEMGEIQDRMD